MPSKEENLKLVKIRQIAITAIAGALDVEPSRAYRAIILYDHTVENGEDLGVLKVAINNPDLQSELEEKIWANSFNQFEIPGVVKKVVNSNTVIDYDKKLAQSMLDVFEIKTMKHALEAGKSSRIVDAIKTARVESKNGQSLIEFVAQNDPELLKKFEILLGQKLTKEIDPVEETLNKFKGFKVIAPSSPKMRHGKSPLAVSENEEGRRSDQRNENERRLSDSIASSLERLSGENIEGQREAPSSNIQNLHLKIPSTEQNSSAQRKAGHQRSHSEGDKLSKPTNFGRIT